jgi:hypothetical protein
MTNEYVLWIAAAVYGIHMIEETVYDWSGWARRVLGLPGQWNEFYVVNAVVGLLGISCAMIGWRSPAVALMFPAFMLVNAVLFHILPVLVTRIFSPGFFTAVVLFLPVGLWCYKAAGQDGVLTPEAMWISGAGGFILMMVLPLWQKTKRLAVFRQDA